MIKDELLYELILQDEEDGVFANSIVNSPAIERDFVFFGKEIYFQSVSEEKRLVAGPLLIPNKKILRLDGEGKPYSVFFKPKTIEMISRKFMKNKFGDQVTIEHGSKTNGVYLTESWIIEQSEKDKSNIYGFTLPKGTWFGIYKIDNDKVWQDIKEQKFKGFSIEGLFEHKKSDIKLSLVEKPIDELTESEAEVVLSKIRALIKKDKRYNSKQRVEMESYSDYGDGVKNNAKRALDWANKNGWGSCGTPVGKQRANQLAKGEPISIDTIKRMFSFLSRHERDLESSTSYGDGCGKLMYDAWGGKAGLGWSRNKLRELDLLTETEAQPSVTSTYPGEGPYKKKKQKMAIEKPNVNVFGYHTRYFDMCPGAQALFEHLITMQVDEETIGMIRSAAQVADNVFRKEKEVIEVGVATQHDYEEVLYLVDDFKDIMHEIDEEVGMMHDVSFMDGHVEKVKGYL